MRRTRSVLDSACVGCRDADTVPVMATNDDVLAAIKATRGEIAGLGESVTGLGESVAGLHESVAGSG